MSFAPFETDRFLLRPAEPDDAAALSKIFPEQQHFSSAAPANKTEALHTWQEWIAQARRDLLAGDRFAFLILPRGGGVPLGVVELALAAARAGVLSCRISPECPMPNAALEVRRSMAAFGVGTLQLAHIGNASSRDIAAPHDIHAGHDTGAKKTLYVAAAALFDDNRRVLLTQRPQGKSMAGLWEFPGGKVEPGERPPRTVVRELEEELGLEVSPANVEPWDITCHDYGGFHLMMPLLRCRSWRGAPRPREGQAMAWVEPARLGALPMPAADRPLILRLASAAAG